MLHGALKRNCAVECDGKKVAFVSGKEQLKVEWMIRNYKPELLKFRVWEKRKGW
jgi:hypothetical protein